MAATEPFVVSGEDRRLCGWARRSARRVAGFRHRVCDCRSLVGRMDQLLNQGGLAMATLNRLNHVWLLLAYFGVFLIVILSLVPGTWRPHTGAGGLMEHLAAYTLVATAFGFALANTRQAFVYGIGLTAVAGLLEELQHFSPGRTPNIEGFLASSSGVWLGFGMSAIVIMVLRRVQAGEL
jgi:hypothetical protein